MSHSVIDVICTKCSKKYYGVLQGIFQAEGEYATSCPKCNSQTFIRNGASVQPLNISIPDRAVPVMFVKVL